MFPEPTNTDRIIVEATKGAVKRLAKVRKESKRALTWDDIFKSVDGVKSLAGVHVNEQKSLQIVAVHACVSYIADYVASLPKIIYERLEKGKKRATDHYLYPIIHDQVNPYMNDYEFAETMTGHALLWGNAFAEQERNAAGEVVALWPLRPDQMRIQLFNGRVYYYYRRPDGIEQQLTDVFHLRGLGSDGIIGYSPIQLHKEAIGLAFAEEEYRSRFFSNNASPGGVLETAGEIGNVERLKKQWHDAHTGLSNSHRIAVLEYGVKWQHTGVPAKDMEYVEGRKYQKAEIASIYRVKPYKIGILEPGTVSFASIEQQAIDTHMDTMRPWVIRWEKKFNSLFSQAERRKFFVEFLFDAVLRADSESRARTLQTWRQNGLINADDWLELENRNPLPDGKGQDFWMPSNMQVVGEEPEPLTAPGQNGKQPMNGKGVPVEDGQ